MTAYVALFRGINVGGKHSLPMQDLRDILSSLGCEDVQTYIQSGNAVFSSVVDAQSLSGQIKDAIEKRCGFGPPVLLLTVERFQAIAAANPFPDGEETPKLLHVAFLTAVAPNPDLEALHALKAPSEQFLLCGDAFYLYAPDGIGRSKLAVKIDRHLGVATTARNWRTVTKLLKICKESKWIQ
ncbi:MAG: DUF1697 domain-containing protein [Gammaproteobacteria bacterium]|nr:DUF1697 domain-containing protein [Gammaproteobacteria bacterium]MDH3749585.1 DUF1697 domain-containing protein [Gammaproteobacteria bacterium]MDH3805198.1 DUF1697 domain-containing protein [Gammaproteobacteria bacterium]